MAEFKEVSQFEVDSMDGGSESSDCVDDDDGSGSGSEEDVLVRPSWGLLHARTAASIRSRLQATGSAKASGATCKSQFLLALSVGFWVAVFGIPMYSVDIYYTVFGQRGDPLLQRMRSELNETSQDRMLDNITEWWRLQLEIYKLRLTCASTDSGKMRNIATDGHMPQLVTWDPSMSPWRDENNEDIWCGIFPRAYLANWPNVAQFIIFSVYKNTGTTINLATQGIIGTSMAGLNMHLMTFLFPHGARGRPCVEVRTRAKRGKYTIVTISRSDRWRVKQASTLAQAIQIYRTSDLGGLKGRAMFDPLGGLNKYYHWFWPDYEEKVRKFYERIITEKCKAGEIVYYDPNYAKYGRLVCFIDVAVVLFLFLFSKSAKNTIMFGMSWHVSWMMSFMNPTIGIEKSAWSWYGSDSFVVDVTTLIGAFFAVVATLTTGMCMCNLRYLYTDCKDLTYSITTIWKEAGDYLKGRSRSAQRFKIETRIDTLQAVASKVQDHIVGAWWETFDIGSFGKTRMLLNVFQAAALEIKPTFYVVKSCVLSETFQGEHETFMASVGDKVDDLRDATTRLMWVCLEASRDGEIEEREVREISALADQVQEVQLQLLKAFHKCKPGISNDLSDEQIFIFGLASWSRKVRDFSSQIIDLARGGKIRGHGTCLRHAINSVRATWSPSVVFQHEHVSFVLRNFLSIMLCFLIGYSGNGSIFDRYSATMANTLTLLFVSDGSHHVDHEKCTHRLLGVSLGKSLPIMISAFLDYFKCYSWERFLFQGLLIWFYVSGWMFVYFNSHLWSYVACLICGFGVYQLMEPCAGGGQSDIFAAKYKEIGSITVAIIIQGLVHAIFQRRNARDLLLDTLRELGETLRNGTEALFQADLQGMQHAVEKAKGQFKVAKVLVEECDPKLQVVQGRSPPFNMDFCRVLIGHEELLLSELSLATMVSHEWVVTGSTKEADVKSVGVLELLCRMPSIVDVHKELACRGHFLSTIIPEMLDGRFEADGLRDPAVVRVTMHLESADQLYEELAEASHSLPTEEHELTDDIRVRLAILVRCLQNAAFHFAKMEERCIKEATH